jgi:membrane-bound inhibitor of C-type lysozyme
MKSNYIGLVIILLLIVVAGGYGFKNRYTEMRPTAQIPDTTAAYTFMCDGGKSITATYATSSVALSLSDGRTLELPQAISGSGFRYENSDPITFIGKGDDAYLEEKGTQTYMNCVVNTAADGTTASSTNTYTFKDGGHTLSFEYPKDVIVSGGGIGYSTAWQNQAVTSGLVLATAELPRTFQPNTNFGEAKFSIGTSADTGAVSSCYSNHGLGGTSVKTVINGVNYTKLMFTDVGAGNIYDTTSYRTVRNSQCYTIEYTIHSSNIANYDPSQGITQFDTAAVKAKLESIVQSVTFL